MDLQIDLAWFFLWHFICYIVAPHWKDIGSFACGLVNYSLSSRPLSNSGSRNLKKLTLVRIRMMKMRTRTKKTRMRTTGTTRISTKMKRTTGTRISTTKTTAIVLATTMTTIEL